MINQLMAIMHISADHGTAYLISLPRDSYVPGVGSVELLNGASMQLLRSVKADDVAAFLKTHPTWRAG
jgi:anionic cell wall polymer biosynthesis LytR-Cps2A-Psr (LCP) family protein